MINPKVVEQIRYEKEVESTLANLSKIFKVGLLWIGSREKGRDIDILLNKKVSIDTAWKIADYLHNKFGVRVDVFMPLTRRDYWVRDWLNIPYWVRPEQIYIIFCSQRAVYVVGWVYKNLMEKVARLSKRYKQLKKKFEDILEKEVRMINKYRKMGYSIDEALKLTESFAEKRRRIVKELNSIKEQIEKYKGWR